MYFGKAAEVDGPNYPKQHRNFARKTAQILLRHMCACAAQKGLVYQVGRLLAMGVG